LLQSALVVSMKSLASVCTAIGLFCVLPVSSPPLARGSAALPRVASSSAALQPALAAAPKLEQTPSGAYTGAPPVTRLQILDIAKSALGVPYVRGAESWPSLPQARSGTDCSGLIAKAWQAPRALETWEEMRMRPTTETLNVETSRWFKLPVSERQPGDVLVRYGALVRHAFIYERDAADFAESGAIWVYEAAEPNVQHRRYRLAELVGYTLTRRRGIDDVGLVGRSRDWIYGDMIDAFRQAGGERFVGTPYDRGEGILVHEWRSEKDAGVAQDFHGGQLGELRLVRSHQRPGAFIVLKAPLDDQPAP
jgi:hypothetical protein